MKDVGWPWALCGWVAFVPVWLIAFRRASGSGAQPAGVEHTWLGGAVVVAFLWQFAFKVGSGPAIGMLGVALYALLFGWARSVLGLTLALILFVTLRAGSFRNLGLDGLLLAALPAFLTRGAQLTLERFLPRLIFVFIIGNGLFTTLFTTAVTGVCLSLAALVTGIAAADLGIRPYLGPILLLAWGEALCSGMLFSALVVYRPDLVLTYEQDVYLPPA